MSVVVVIVVAQNTGRTVVLSFLSGLMQSSPDFLWSFFSGFHSFSIQRPEGFQYLNQIPTQDHSLWGHSLPFDVWPFKTVQLTLQVLISQVFTQTSPPQGGRPSPPRDQSHHPAPHHHSMPSAQNCGNTESSPLSPSAPCPALDCEFHESRDLILFIAISPEWCLEQGTDTVGVQ